jgi:hypothetical protein
MSANSHRLLRMLSSRLNDIEEWRVGDAALAAAKGYPREYPAEIIDDWGIAFLDLALDAATGLLTCHEVNGPNGVGSDALTGDSIDRARNEAAQAARRAREMGYRDAHGRLNRQVVSIHAHQHWVYFRTGGEFFPRVEQFAQAIAEFLPGQEAVLRDATDALGNERVSVVVGEVPRIAAALEINPETERFEYFGRPVVFAGNPNLLPELVRLRKIPSGYSAELPPAMRIFHAWRLSPLIHDKALQQRLLRGTGIKPQRHFEAVTEEEAVVRAREMSRHDAVVLKPNGTSGGTGVHVVAPGMPERAIRERVAAVIADCRAKYGSNVEEMIFPLRGFQFMRSTGYPMADGEHLWDLRIAVPFEPGRAWAYPVTLRLAPRAFDPATFHRDRDQWVSNLSGRQSTHLKSGMDDEVLARVGLTPEKMQLALDASVLWTLKAWDYSVRNCGHKERVHEDEAEERDPAFYPVAKFNPEGAGP